MSAPAKISVHEFPGVWRRLLLAVLSVPVTLLSIFGGIFFLQWSFENNQSFPFSMLVFVLIVFAPACALVFLASFGRKTTATPIMLAGKDPDPYAPFIMFGLVGAFVGEMVGRKKFLICEEGVVIGRRFGPILHRWERIRSFTADRTHQQFVLKLGRFGQAVMRSEKTFDEVERLLSEHIARSPPFEPPP
jgi:hypothetical protein